MRMSRVVVIFVLPILMSACTSGPSEKEFSPKIGDIYTNITQFRSGSSVDDPATDANFLSIDISVNVTDPDGLDDITDIYFRDKENDLRGSLLNTSIPGDFARCNEGGDLFNCTFWLPGNSQTFNLKNYEVVAIDRHGYTTKKPFDFKLPAGEALESESFTYTSDFTGEMGEGLEALESLSVQSNDIAFYLDQGSQTMHVEFESKDPRVDRYSFTLYKTEDKLIEVGSVSFLNSNIQDNPIISGFKTSVDIPFTEITFNPKSIEENFDETDIEGLRIKLYDQPTDWMQASEGSLWFNYVGVSEYIELDI
ncbi:MAG: hypothetical protein ACMZ64_04310 [Oleiphilus sp.]